MTQSFLTQMTGLPGAQSEVDTSATLLQLDMASALDSDLSPDLRVAIALTVNRQDLVNQQASWAAPGIAPGNSHLVVQGQPNYKPPSTGSPTTTVPPATLVDVDHRDRRRRQRELPGDAGADARRRLPGRDRTGAHAGRPVLPLVFRRSLPAAHGLRLERSLGHGGGAGDPVRAAWRPGLDTTLLPVAGAAQTGQVLAAGFADLAVLPQTFTPYMSQTMAWYTHAARAAGEERLAGLDGLLERPVRHHW